MQFQAGYLVKVTKFCRRKTASVERETSSAAYLSMLMGLQSINTLRKASVSGFCYLGSERVLTGRRDGMGVCGCMGVGGGDFLSQGVLQGFTLSLFILNFEQIMACNRRQTHQSFKQTCAAAKN